MNRRQFLKFGLVAGAVLLAPSSGPFGLETAAGFYQTPLASVSRFQQPIRGVFPIDANGIPVAIPNGTRSWKFNGVTTVAQHYSIDINQFTDKIHTGKGMRPTTLWGFHPRQALGGKVPQRHLGGIIVAQKGTPVQITFQNNLPNKHILPVDTSIMGASLGANRTSVHLHGGGVPWVSDGGPFAWFDPKGRYGSSVANKKVNHFKVLNPKLQPGQAEYYYPNNQSARMLWYHDHAVGITRLNAYAGIASAYIIRDNFEAGLVLNSGLPEFIEKGGNELPLVIQEKVFVGKDIATMDPTWSKVTPPDSSTPGSLWYPHVYENRWGSAAGSVQPDPSAIPEFFGDTMLVNGVVHPFAKIQPRRYRLRILNATQARFLNLQLYEDNGTGNPNFATRGPDFLVIGTEGGFLANPVVVPSNQPMIYLTDNASVDPANPGGSLLTAPGERWDVIVDFANFGGKSFILCNDAPAPFPMGDSLNDHTDLTGLTTRVLMRFDVAAAATLPADKPLLIDASTSLAAGIDPLFADAGGALLPGVTVDKERVLTLNEIFDETGRLIQMLGTDTPTQASLPMGYTTDPAVPVTYAQTYDAPATENAVSGQTEIWRIANLTGDVHPMHFHLVNVQVLSRQPITINPDGSFDLTLPGGAQVQAPPALEYGWKETVKMNPGEVTSVIMRFDLPAVPFVTPPSLRTGGNEYVWHCHILEHEEHDMMRPLIVS